MVPPSDEVLSIAKLDADIPIGNEFDDYARHLGSHPDYTKLIDEKIMKIEQDFVKGLITKEKAHQKLVDITNSAKNAIKSGNGLKVNDLIF